MHRMLLTLAFLLSLLPARASGQALTCNGIVTIDYITGSNFSVPGDTLRIRLTLGTASINGGTHLTIQQLRMSLDCNSNNPLGLPCTDEGSFVAYGGDATITNTCGKTFTTGHAAGDTPNEVVFTPDTPIVIPANQAVPPGFCVVEFDVEVLNAPSVDQTPDFIEEVAGYTNLDAKCDNNVLASGGSQSSAIPLCPTCADIECNANVCNQDTGECVATPVDDSTPCGDTDSNACTTAGCEAGQCVQGHMTTVCTPDDNECTNDLPCNPETGLCEHPPKDDSTPCTDNDSNACTTAGCEAGFCVQGHIEKVCEPDAFECTFDLPCNPDTGSCDHPNVPDSTPCTDTDNQACTTAGCEMGVCVQAHISTCQGFTRTVGFWKNHPALTQSILTDTGGLEVCGVLITNTSIDDPQSALEAMCGPATGPAGKRFSCCKQLMAAALNGAAGGASFPDLAHCNDVCGDPSSPDSAVTACNNEADDFNQSGDNLDLPFAPGSAKSGPCKKAADTDCRIVTPNLCS